MKWNELLRGVDKVTPHHKLGGSRGVRNLDVKYDIDKQQLTFTGSIPSSSGAGAYDITVKFLKIEVTDGLTDDEIMQGYMPKPTLADDDLQVRCTCPSYRFRFHSANNKVGASIGDFGPYHRKTDRKPNNPDNTPGLCYHIIDFMDYLKSQGFVH